MGTALELDPEPYSVRTARVWICDELDRIGRADLSDSAALGISELVTNALLHSHPPITIRLSGTEANPRVEVHDGSLALPAVREMTRDSRQTATVGRGLGIVAAYSRTWGTDLFETGKAVWFEPMADSETGQDAHVMDMPGDLFDLEGLLAEHGENETAADEPARCTVRLRNMPMPLIARYQIWFEDLCREMRLLALNHGVQTALARELADAAHEILEARRHFTGMDRIEAAMKSGDETLDVDLEVPFSSGRKMARLLDVLERADVLCRQQQTLTLPPDTGVVNVRTWYHAEFVRQIHGEAPRPWQPSAQDPTSRPADRTDQAGA